ncbi:hypothetical protein TM7_0317 [candidate division TM7 genomosp. GTL1]|nr:hypothetical protein TM7_0317 [candidate division TM7 genomosp. GTL1]
MSKRQEETKKKLLQELARTPIAQVACKNASVGRATYYRWRKEDEQFAEAVDAALEQSVGLINDMAESQLISSIKEKNMTAIIFWLKFHHPAYETRVKVDANIHHEQQELSPEQALIVAQALKCAGLLGEGTPDEQQS